MREINSKLAKRELYQLIKYVNKTKNPIHIIDKKGNNAVLLSKDTFNALKETIFLENKGIGQIVRKREKDKSGFTNIEEIEWNKL